LAPGAEVALDALFEHPEFIIIKEQMNKANVEDLINFIQKPFTPQQAVEQVLTCPVVNFT